VGNIFATRVTVSSCLYGFTSPVSGAIGGTADMTYVWTDEGWLYLAVVLDLFNREIVGWSIKPRMTADIAVDALTMAWFRRKPAPGLIHHSDRGSQYASGVFQDKLVEFGMTCSMSRKGNCWDTQYTMTAAAKAAPSGGIKCCVATARWQPSRLP